MCSQITELGHGDLYMTELLGRVPTIPIPIFNGIQKFRLASSSIQVFIQMIDPMGLTLSVKVKLTKSTNSLSSDIVFIACIHELSKGIG